MYESSLRSQRNFHVRVTQNSPPFQNTQTHLIYFSKHTQSYLYLQARPRSILAWPIIFGGAKPPHNGDPPILLSVTRVTMSWASIGNVHCAVSRSFVSKRVEFVLGTCMCEQLLFFDHFMKMVSMKEHFCGWMMGGSYQHYILIL